MPQIYTSYRSTARYQRRQRVGTGRVLLHTFLTCITGGAWLLVLVIRFLLK